MRDEEARAAEEYGSRREAEPGKTELVSGKLLGRGEALIRGTRREHTYSEMDLYGGDEVTKEIVSVSPYHPTQLTGVPREEEPWPRRDVQREDEVERGTGADGRSEARRSALEQNLPQNPEEEPTLSAPRFWTSGSGTTGRQTSVVLATWCGTPLQQPWQINTDTTCRSRP